MRALCLDGPLKGKFISSEYTTFLYAEPNEDNSSILDVGQPPGPIKKIEVHEYIYKLRHKITINDSYYRFWTIEDDYCEISALMDIIEEGNSEEIGR